MTRRRLWLFRVVSVVLVPLLLLVLLEAGLRVSGVGHPAGFTRKCEVGGAKAYCENDLFSWTFFPHRIARPPIPFVIPAHKTEKTYRIFILGGSAAQGDPDSTYAFGRILEAMLRDRYPGVNFEVVNAAVTAINSHVVLPIARDLSRRDADLFIIYMGNNEVVGPYGAGTVFSPLSPNLPLIRAGIALKSTRIGRLIGKLVRRTRRSGKLPERWKGMEMFLGNQVRAEDPRMEKVYGYFRKNLQDILKVARKAGIKTIVSTVGSNLKDSAPFSSLHRPDITEAEKKEWERLYETGIQLEEAGNHSGAMQLYLEAARIDDRFAGLHYRLGRAYWKLGRYEEARKRYILARNLDTLRFRADSRVNDIIRTVTTGRQEENIYLVDAAEAFENISPHKTPGSELFHEHVHMNFHGNYILAKTIFKQVGRIIPERVRRFKNSRPTLSEDQAARRLAFTLYDRGRIAAEILKRLTTPPFTNQLDHEAQLALKEKEAEKLRAQMNPVAFGEAFSRYLAAIRITRSDPWLHYNFALLMEGTGNYSGAAEQFEAFLRYMPQHYGVYEKLASALIRQGKFEEAVARCREAIRIAPRFTASYYTMAFALARLGRFEESIRVYDKLLRLDPGTSAQIYNEKGRILIRQGRLEEAARTLKKAVEYNARSGGKNIPDIHYNFGYALKKSGRETEAVRELSAAENEYREELRKNPGSSALHAALGNTLVELDDFKKASERFRRAVELDPANPSHRLNLIRTLEAQGRIAEAAEAARKAVKAMNKAGKQKETAMFLQTLRFLRHKP